MANNTERAMLQAMIHPAATPLCEQPLFTGFTSDEAILAAFVDSTLDPAQHKAVQAALASRGELRHVWQAMREAGQASAAASRPVSKKNRLPIWGGLGLAASLVLVVLVQIQRERQTMTSVAITAEQTSAPSLASRAVPVAAWQAFIATYDDPQNTEIGQGDAAQLAFIQLARQATPLQTNECTEAQVQPLQEAFIQLSLQYPEELAPLTPGNTADWCQLGAVLRQTAAMAVSTHNH